MMEPRTWTRARSPLLLTFSLFAVAASTRAFAAADKHELVVAPNEDAEQVGARGNDMRGDLVPAAQSVDGTADADYNNPPGSLVSGDDDDDAIEVVGAPSLAPSARPTVTMAPSAPTLAPSFTPTGTPTSGKPSYAPTTRVLPPSAAPTATATYPPTISHVPSAAPTVDKPTALPTPVDDSPTSVPTSVPTAQPSLPRPTASTSFYVLNTFPTKTPTYAPTPWPTMPPLQAEGSAGRRGAHVATAILVPLVIVVCASLSCLCVRARRGRASRRRQNARVTSRAARLLSHRYCRRRNRKRESLAAWYERNGAGGAAPRAVGSSFAGGMREPAAARHAEPAGMYGSGGAVPQPYVAQPYAPPQPP